jgi:5'-3' exonuclease/transcription antitermination factor NusG
VVAVADQWVILELGPKAEGEDPDLIRRSIRGSIRDAEVFVPAAVTTVGQDKVVRYAFDGYAFVKKTHPDQVYVRLANTRYVAAVLQRNGKLALATDAQVRRMKAQVSQESEQGISVGDTVLIMSGPYRQIQAIVHEDIQELSQVQVLVKLRSKEAIVTLPRNFLQLVTKAPKPAVERRMAEALAWLRSMRPVLLWRNNGAKLLRPAEAHRRLSVWVPKWQALYGFVQALGYTKFDPKPLSMKAVVLKRVASWLSKWQATEPVVSRVTRQVSAASLVDLSERTKTLGRLASWESRWTPLYSFVNVFYTPPSRARVDERAMEWLWLKDAVGRLEAIGEEVRLIEESMSAVLEIDMDHNPSFPEPDPATAPHGTIDHVVVDGLNLAARCAYAPGLSELRDSKGRPSGIYTGFLRSLGSFVKRYSGALIHVVWDGSSGRRKAAYAGYKADRKQLPITPEQLTWIKETLPLLGVSQSYHPEEEADDVIAALVRGPLAGKRNLIFSTDRDLLQVVSRTDVLLTPAVGKAKETFHDPDTIQEAWGVGPDQIVALRALYGDTSDKLPGVGFDRKVLLGLVRAYGTIDKIFASNLAGLTKSQYAKMRSSEKQVRLNAELMTLRIDLPITTIDPKPDRKAALARLQDVDCDTILPTFHPERVAGFAKTT